ncbi:MAG: CoA transferase [Dehalococcoidales bacterium]|nr:CoA transferase [Dehalococcoidales bacterium]
MKAALGDLKIIEYASLINGPYCSKMLADMGADVIKIEKNGGDDARRRGPFLADIPGAERSGLFLYVNTNKRGITLDITTATGKEILRKLLTDADIFIEDTRPGTLSSLGLGYAALKELNPRLIMTSVTPFGQTGPCRRWKSSDLIGWEIGGMGFITPRHAGSSDQEPLRLLQTISFITGVTAAMGTMFAVEARRYTGLGQQVDCSQIESAIYLSGDGIAYPPYEHRSMSRTFKTMFGPEHLVRCQDGFVMVHGMEPHHWRGLAELTGNTNLVDDERFKDTFLRGQNWDILQPLIEAFTMQHTKDELFQMAKDKAIPMGPARTMDEILKAEQFKFRQFFINIEHSETGRLTYPGAPCKYSTMRWKIRRPAPRLGEHNEEVYCGQLGFSRTELVRLYEAGII